MKALKGVQFFGPPCSSSSYNNEDNNDDEYENNYYNPPQLTCFSLCFYDVSFRRKENTHLWAELMELLTYLTWRRNDENFLLWHVPIEVQ